MPFTEAIASRAVGQLPLSIATSLAIESAIGIHPEIVVKRAPILDYPELWVNMRTLFRNFMGALDKRAQGGVTPPAIAEAIAVEMDQIVDIITENTKSKTKVVFYISNYADMERKYKHAAIRRDNTDLQKTYTALMNQTMEIMLKKHKDHIQVFERKLKPLHKPTAIMLTHVAFDLCSAKSFSELVLLESHTGKIKERAQWYTKYHNGKELSMFPFQEGLLQVFGDSETFRPGDPKLRKELIDIATKYKWSAVLTKDKMLYGINQMQNPYYRDVLKEILV